MAPDSPEISEFELAFRAFVDDYLLSSVNPRESSPNAGAGIASEKAAKNTALTSSSDHRFPSSIPNTVGCATTCIQSNIAAGNCLVACTNAPTKSAESTASASVRPLQAITQLTRQTGQASSPVNFIFDKTFSNLYSRSSRQAPAYVSAAFNSASASTAAAAATARNVDCVRARLPSLILRPCTVPSAASCRTSSAASCSAVAAAVVPPARAAVVGEMSVHQAGGRHKQVSSAASSETTARAVEKATARQNIQIGDFVVAREHAAVALSQPVIWRVDRHNVLQRFFRLPGQSNPFFESSSKYLPVKGSLERHYRTVPVRIEQQSGQAVCIVQLLAEWPSTPSQQQQQQQQQQQRQPPAARPGQNLASLTNSIASSHNKRVASLADTAAYLADFEIYIQVLVSHALDANFLPQIVHANDTFFLKSLSTIDKINAVRMRKLLVLAKWSANIESCLRLHPYLLVEQLGEPLSSRPATSHDASVGGGGGWRVCQLCCSSSSAIECRLKVTRRRYDPATLKMHVSPPHPSSSSSTAPHHLIYRTCCTCANIADLFNKVVHLQYHLFVECRREVDNVSQRISTSANGNNNTRVLGDGDDDIQVLCSGNLPPVTHLLKTVMSNSAWIQQCFNARRILWADIDEMAAKGGQTAATV